MTNKFLPWLVAAALGVAATAAQADTLADVKAKGFLQCGANTGLLGFGSPDDKGEWKGFDVDFCRAIAVAIFNDPTKVKFTPLTAKERFSPRCSRARSTSSSATPPGRCRATARWA